MPGDVAAALQALVAALERGGLTYVLGDAATATTQAEAMGVAYLHWRGIRLDMFVPSIPFYDEALRKRVRVEMPGAGPTWVLSAASLAVFNLLFFRPKDLLDLEKLIAVQRDRLDAALVRSRIVAMVGNDDERVVWWDRLLARTPPVR